LWIEEFIRAGGNDITDRTKVYWTLPGRDGNGFAPHRGVPSHPHPHLTIGETFFPIPIPIGFGAGIGFPIMKLNSNDLLIILGFSFFYMTINKK
jgi:hypothetical protein